MLKKSSNFAKVFFADKRKILEQLKDYAKRLKRIAPEVEKVGLFGSYTTNSYGPSSDVDLLIVLRQSPKRFLDRIPDYLPENLSVSCDVFPYTKKEIAKMRKESNPWFLHISKEVVWL